MLYALQISPNVTKQLEKVIIIELAVSKAQSHTANTGHMSCPHLLHSKTPHFKGSFIKKIQIN